MNSSGLKAREIEALAFIQSPQSIPPGDARPRPAPYARLMTAGAAAITIVAAALAWVVLRR